MSVVLSPAAQNDLRAIWLYSARQWGRRRADTYIDNILMVIGESAQSPNNRRSCDAVKSGYFRVKSGSHVIFYQLHTDSLDVKRILHQSMDFQRHL